MNTSQTTTVAKCPNEQHCWHEGTAVETYCCCRCGATKANTTRWKHLTKPLGNHVVISDI